MNRAETHDLLAFIAAYDNRRFDDATVLAWHAVFAETEFADSRAAVIDHFATSDAYLMPVHVRRGADAAKRDRRRRARERGEALALEAELAKPRRDRSEDVRKLIAELRDSLPDGDPDKLRRAEWVEHDRRRERWPVIEPNPHYDPTSVIPFRRPA